jgi:hypothetical protein
VGPSARWRFAWGCLRTSLFAPVRRTGFALAVCLLVLADAAVVAIALIRYPGLRSGVGVWVAVSLFVVVLTIYALSAAALARRTSGAAVASVVSALVGGLAVAAIWTGFGVAVSEGADRLTGPLMLVGFPLACLAVGVIGTRRGGATTGALGVLLSGVVAGLVVFLAWTGDTVARDGRPYDAGLMRDFHSSGARDLATYAVDDSIGTAMMLLLVVPLLTILLGLVGRAAVLAVSRARRGRR